LESVSLSELNEYVQRVIALNFEEALWVNFELSNVKTSRGHTYFDAIEKKEDSDEVIAHSSGAIWAGKMAFLKKKLQGIEEEILQNGVRIAAKVAVEYHPRYGLKLVVQDIDPAYTFGELSLERDRTWKRIVKEGLHEVNTSLPLPPVLQRVAILSNDTAAGYVDFVHQLESNGYGYDFDLTLFEISLQGAGVKRDLPYQMDIITEEASDFDVVVVIRGGGSRLDLSAFDQYEVVKAIANCPVPVWTGIGHEIDDSLCDMVAHRSVKTPTAAASALIDNNLQFESRILDSISDMEDIVKDRMTTENKLLDHALFDLSRIAFTRIREEGYVLERTETKLKTIKRQMLKAAENHLDKAETLIKLLDPQVILEKGFAFVEKDGKRVRGSHQLEVDDDINIHLSKGQVTARIKNIES
jgi:exodeoxyribonuclease VII large subunit